MAQLLAGNQMGKAPMICRNPGPADRAGARQDGIGPPETTAGNNWATDNRKFLQKNKEQPAEKAETAPECS